MHLVVVEVTRQRSLTRVTRHDRQNTALDNGCRRVVGELLCLMRGQVQALYFALVLHAK